jgi:hypothetical protein
MDNLIPIGTVNRTTTENNAVKSTDNVKETDKIARIEADQRQKVEPPRRRFKRRQGDRRVSSRSARLNRFERRKSRDRRDDDLDENGELLNDGAKAKAPSRKGRFIDERA